MKQLKQLALACMLAFPLISFAAEEAKDAKQAQACPCAQAGATCEADGKTTCPCACVTPAAPAEKKSA